MRWFVRSGGVRDASVHVYAKRDSGLMIQEELG